MVGHLEVSVLAPLCVLAKLPTVVAPQHHDRGLSQAKLVQVVKDSAYLGVDVRHCCIVRSPQGLGRLVRQCDIDVSQARVQKLSSGNVTVSPKLIPAAPSYVWHLFRCPRVDR